MFVGSFLGFEIVVDAVVWINYLYVRGGAGEADADFFESRGSAEYIRDYKNCVLFDGFCILFL
jgi:hypothetical protein